jgi:hypothetical protein
VKWGGTRGRVEDRRERKGRGGRERKREGRREGTEGGEQP